MTGAGFWLWRMRSGRTQNAAAEALGWGLSQLRRAERRPDDEVPRTVELACAALDAEAAGAAGSALTMFKAASLHASLVGHRRGCTVQMTISVAGLTVTAVTPQRSHAVAVGFPELAPARVAVLEAAIEEAAAVATDPPARPAPEGRDAP